MRILVVSNRTPFAAEPVQVFAGELVRRLALCGFDADHMAVPVRCDTPERLDESLVVCRSLSLFNTDRVIGLEFPACLGRFDNTVLWLLRDPVDEPVWAASARAARLEGACLTGARRVYAADARTGAALGARTSARVELLAPPSDPRDAEAAWPRIIERLTA